MSCITSWLWSVLAGVCDGVEVVEVLKDWRWEIWDIYEGKCGKHM
jgi:hypothetical protein